MLSITMERMNPGICFLRTLYVTMYDSYIPYFIRALYVQTTEKGSCTRVAKTSLAISPPILPKDNWPVPFNETEKNNQILTGVYNFFITNGINNDNESTNRSFLPLAFISLLLLAASLLVPFC